MLTITIPATELFNESTQEFIQTKEHTIVLEHSLVSLSKWESKWRKTILIKRSKNCRRNIRLYKMYDNNTKCRPKCI